MGYPLNLGTGAAIFGGPRHVGIGAVAHELCAQQSDNETLTVFSRGESTIIRGQNLRTMPLVLLHNCKISSLDLALQASPYHTSALTA